MDSLKSRGHFRRFELESGEEASRPILVLRHQSDSGPVSIEFLVDTGADLSLIAPNDAVRIWGVDNYVRLDFDDLDPSVTKDIGGVGGEIRCAWKSLRLGFPLHETNNEMTLTTAQILVAPPTAQFGISLLGWDIMSKFRRIEFNPAEGVFDLILLSIAPQQ